ncbi:GNAT family N-acyltransferase [Piscinibacter sakaiensis]|uniref:L-ornithine N(alpha)-acyltransferase n=1 Tax=Piscinibacter sakaiensis TaxID=1547922 RepID=A0A0K8P4H4_PISS1|nr:GNAT family N-acyltransferase [Piscinibacter sakaiensis]GAP37552.1 putative hemolysin [Piscinibacter sakaiensis]
MHAPLTPLTSPGRLRLIDPAALNGALPARRVVGFETAWARHADEVAEAQRLRHRVFVEELGARPRVPPGTPAGHEADLFDAHCEHLLLRPRHDDGSCGPVVGTYRVLTAAAARRTGGFCSDTAFDLTRLRPLRARMAELGRACVAPQWRAGFAVGALWGALAEFMPGHGVETVIGCASLGLRDGGHAAASLWERLRAGHLAPIEHHVQPRIALPVEALSHQLAVETPALLRAYLRCGARLLGPPAWDTDFQTADLPLMLRLADLQPRWRRLPAAR